MLGSGTLTSVGALIVNWAGLELPKSVTTITITSRGLASRNAGIVTAIWVFVALRGVNGIPSNPTNGNGGRGASRKLSPVMTRFTGPLPAKMLGGAKTVGVDDGDCNRAGRQRRND